MERELKIGQHLIFIDADRQERDALLICIHGDPKGGLQEVVKGEDGEPITDDRGYMKMRTIEGTEGKHWPCLNLVVVDKNDGAKDQYGRQTVKEGVTSVVHWEGSSAHGFCWRFADEEVVGQPAPSIS